MIILWGKYIWWNPTWAHDEKSQQSRNRKEFPQFLESISTKEPTKKNTHFSPKDRTRQECPV